MSTNDKWLEWAHRIEAEALNGMAYPNKSLEFSFHKEHYERIAEVAAEMKAAALAASARGEELGGDLEPALKAHLMKFQQRLLNADNVYGNYQTPKVDVRGVVFDAGGRILLVKELRDGGYTLPGGWVDVCDLPKESAEREVREETGFETKASKLLAVFVNYLHGHPEDPRFRIYKLFVRCDLLGGAAKDSNETEGAAFFREDEVDGLTLSLPRTTHWELHRMFEHFRNPDLPTDCD